MPAVEGLQGVLLQVEISQFIMHEADEPNAVADLLDAEFLAAPFLLCHIHCSICGDAGSSVVEGADQQVVSAA